MSLTNMPSSERTHIAFFGMRNAGKSSIVNAVTGQQLSIVSEQLGTTTDPVMKAMEILPLGPVVIIDTPGFDDEGKLGDLRVQKTREVLRRTDIAVLVVDGTKGLQPCDQELLALFREQRLPVITVYNKSDLADIKEAMKESVPASSDVTSGQVLGNSCEVYTKSGSTHKFETVISVSAKTGEGINLLKETIGRFGMDHSTPKFIIKDLIKPKDLIILVIPIDESAPKDRIILPQQMVLRECLDNNAMALCVQHTELSDLLNSLSYKPAIVITDSQVFGQVAKDTPIDIPLTSFSILLARYKGFLDTAVKGVSTINNLNDKSRILIAEGCTHHRQCNDIGTVKLPKMLEQRTGCKLSFDTCSGRDFPSDLSKYDLVIHCGGCMITETEMINRMKQAVNGNIPFTNYGITLSYLNDILPRAMGVFSIQNISQP